MLRRADKEITQHTHGVGGWNWAGKSQQGSDRTHQLDNPLHERPRHMPPCQGGASPLYCKASMVHSSAWLGLSLAKLTKSSRIHMPPPWQGFSTRLKGCRRHRLLAQKCQVEQEVPCAKPSPKRPSLHLNAKGGLIPGCLYLARSVVSEWAGDNPFWPHRGMGQLGSGLVNLNSNTTVRGIQN